MGDNLNMIAWLAKGELLVSTFINFRLPQFPAIVICLWAKTFILDFFQVELAIINNCSIVEPHSYKK